VGWASPVGEKPQPSPGDGVWAEGPEISAREGPSGLHGDHRASGKILFGSDYACSMLEPGAGTARAASAVGLALATS
jgi:hypothetical protein